MITKRRPSPLSALPALLLLAACAGDPYGEASNAYGLYALSDDEFIRLDGTPQWEKTTWSERSDLEPELKLFVHEPRLATIADQRSLQALVRLEETAHLRNEVSIVSGDETLAGGSPWVASGYEPFQVAVDFAPVEGRPTMIYVVPRGPLRPGLYSLRFGDDASFMTARFGIAWTEVNKDQYAQYHCVDRYADRERVAYFQCDGAGTSATDGLKISELRPIRKSVDDVPILTVQGTITNTSDAPRKVPILRARMRDRQGVEQHWTFKMDRAYVLPAESAVFSTEIQYPMPSAERINVSFANEPTSGS